MTGKERKRVQERDERKISRVLQYTILIYNFWILSVILATIVIVIVEIVFKVAAYFFLLQVVIFYFLCIKLQFGGFIAFECKIRGDSPMVVRALRESDHKVAMLTGKNIYEIQLFLLEIFEECVEADFKLIYNTRILLFLFLFLVHSEI